MHTPLRELWWAPLALAALVAGLLLFESAALLPLAIARLVALLLLVYGATLVWWRIRAATRPLQWRVARVLRQIV